MTTQGKESSLLNFKKAKTHLEKIISMTEKDRYCVEIMQQNLAVIGLLKSAHQKLMEGHLNSCFLAGMSANGKTKKEKLIDEILAVTKLYNK